MNWDLCCSSLSELSIELKNLLMQAYKLCWVNSREPLPFSFPHMDPEVDFPEQSLAIENRASPSAYS